MENRKNAPLRHALNTCTQLSDALATVLRTLRGESHLRRWAHPSEMDTEWNTRTHIMAKLIPANSSVLEFGAGSMVLRTYLPPGTQYTPSDIVSRSADTLVIDLNSKSPLPSFPSHDIAVFGGVLEYIFDVERVVRHLSQHVRCVIASYAVTDNTPRTFTRRALGWVNDMSDVTFRRHFEQNNFVCDHLVEWDQQMIYRFTLRAHGLVIRNAPNDSASILR